jgi:hypothetical protein
MGAFQRYTLKNLLSSGGARGLIAPQVVTPITNLSDVVHLTTLDAVAPFVNVGAAREGQGSNYERGLQVQEQNIENATGAIDEDVTDVPRSMTLQFAELTAENIKIIENASEVETLAAAANKSPQKRVPFGSIESLTRYTVVLLGQRRKGRGADITDTAAGVRGGLVAYVLHSATISATNSQMELQKGQLPNVPVELRGFPHPAIADPLEAVGAWYEESGPATIAAA